MNVSLTVCVLSYIILEVSFKVLFLHLFADEETGLRLSDLPTVIRQQSWSLSPGFPLVVLDLQPCVAHAFHFLESWFQMRL